MFNTYFDFENENSLNEDYSFSSNRNESKIGNESISRIKDESIIDYSENNSFLINLKNDLFDFGKQKTSPKTFLSKKTKNNDILENNNYGKDNNDIIYEKEFLLKDYNSYKYYETSNIQNKTINKENSLIENEKEKEIKDTIKSNSNNNSRKCGRKTKI